MEIKIEKNSETTSQQDFVMSYFNAPITNKVPRCQVRLADVARAIKSELWREPTLGLRQIQDEALARSFKGGHFPYITPAGTFSYCNDQSVVSYSGLLCMDLDHIPYPDVEPLKQRLLADGRFITQMAFRSPSGCGLKWFVSIDLSMCSYRQWFTAVRNYLMATYGLDGQQVDAHTGNVSRACFLCHDPEVYLNPQRLSVSSH